jgi:hypothetical protein
MLKWARGQNIPWDEETCMWATNLELLKWAHENGCPWDERTCCNAADDCNLEMLQWARYHGCPWDNTTCSQAVRNLDTFRWCITNGCPYDLQQIVLGAAFTANVPVLDHIYKNFQLPKAMNRFLILAGRTCSRG